MALEEPAILAPPDLGWAWVVIAKCASESIRDCVHRKLKLPYTYAARKTIRRLDSLAELADYQDYFRFAAVSDPWSRLLSCYVDQVALKAKRKLNKQLRKALVRSDLGFTAGMPFSAFVRLIAQLPDARSNAHTASQFDLLSHDGEIVVDHVVHLDRVKEDWAVVQARCGFDALPVRHATNAKLAKYYDEELMDLVATRYAADIEAFKFERPI